MATGTVTGFNHWADLGAALKSRAAGVVAQSAADAFAYSQDVVPVLSGDLQASGRVDTENDGLTAYLVYGTDHAWYVEFGTRDIPAEPYLLPSIQYISTNWADYLLTILSTGGL